MRYALGSDGWFTRDGRRYVPMGANWWPGSCGVELWQAWPEDEIRRDLDVLAGLGLDCLRFFLRWQDMEPEPGAYDHRRLDRAAQLVAWCGERGIAAHPSLFVGFMSGGIFWPAWKGGRNLFADPWMRERSAAFAAAACRAMAGVRDHLLAVDLGNELCCLPESRAAAPAEIAAWCGDVAAAVRAALPGAPVIAGNEQNQVINDTGWRFGQQPGTDLLSMHGYPVQAWQAVPFDGMTDPLAARTLPFQVRCARAFAPVMLQEFGTIAAAGVREQDAYLRAMLPAAWRAGANGFLWWCLRDIAADVHPYVRNPFERELGLVDADGRCKPGLAFFPAFAAWVRRQDAPPPERDAVGLWWPAHHYDRDAPANPGNEPRTAGRRLQIADHLLRELGLGTRIIRGDREIPADVRRILIPGIVLDGRETTRLDAWVAAGGRLVWHGPAGSAWDARMGALVGAMPSDYRAPLPAEVEAFGRPWALRHWPQRCRAALRLDGAAVAAADGRGLPVVLHHRRGAGAVAWCLPIPEEEACDVADRPAERDAWAAWYAGMLALASGPAVSGPAPAPCR